VRAERPYQVRWTEAAARDLEEIVAFVARDSPSSAEQLLTRFRSMAASLERHPVRGRIVPELMRFGMRTWRELVIRPYRLIYRISDRAVTVLGLFDGRRDLEDVLLERILRTP